MNDFGSSAWSAVVTVSTTKKPQTSEDLQRAVTKGDVETVKNILPGEVFDRSFAVVPVTSFSDPFTTVS